jgi:serine phosphatase RsbU (regulator of sigma subunit)
MRIRTQLLLAFVLLSVLPLSAIVLFSYLGSRTALQRASEEETERLTGEMNARLATVREELGAAVERTREMPSPVLVKVFEHDPEAAKALASRIGKAAPYLESFRFVPRPPAAAEPRPEVSGVPAAAPAAPSLPTTRIDVEQIIADLRAAGMAPEAQAAIEREVASAAIAAEAGAARVREQVARTNERERALEQTVFEQKREQARTDAQISAEERRIALEQARVEREQTLPVDAELVTIAGRKEGQTFLGGELSLPVLREGEVIGRIDVEVSGRRIVESILGSAVGSNEEIPFAVDRKGQLHTVDEADRARLGPIRDALAPTGETAHRREGDWIIASSRDPESELVYGIARPMGEPLRELRRSAARNFTFGLGLIGIALVGMVPIANHLTRDIEVLRAGASRIAEGDLQTRVPVRSRNEIGQLATAFNAMAHDLEVHQAEQQQSRLLEAEYERKSHELEEARKFQLSLLPKQVPKVPPFEVAVMMRTATEVGGDYYDFRIGADGVLIAAIGDATGHGARAATMVTIVKSLFAAADVTDENPALFLEQASAAVRRMELERMTMAFSLARFAGTATGAQLTLASAGMPPALVYRAARRTVEEIAIEGVPLGTISMKYEQRSIALERGDAVLFMTDGMPELIGAGGEPFGYPAMQETFRAIAPLKPQEMIDRLAAAAEEWAAGQAPADDITFVAFRVT